MLWNAEDATLVSREVFQMGVMEEFKEALGRVGDKAESYMNLQYFQERVGVIINLFIFTACTLPPHSPLYCHDSAHSGDIP